MPSFENHGATIYYEEYGRGFPILAFAQAGLRSTIDAWRVPASPINVMTELSDKYRVIVMDQRNAGGKSRAPITAKDSWLSYADDHIALLDYLRIDSLHLCGQCIGGSFIMSLLKAQPKRFASAVILQPIGRVGAMNPGYPPTFEAWAKSMLELHPEATAEVLDAFYHNMYDPGFLFSVDRAFVASCQTPCLLLAGNDAPHPYPISEKTAKLLPNCEFVKEWKEGAARQAAIASIREFLAKHTPAAK